MQKLLRGFFIFITVIFFNINLYGSYNYTIFDAAKKGSVNELKKFIEKKKRDPNATDYSFNTPLHHAAAGGNLEAVEYLINKAKANPNLTNGVYAPGKTPIFYAVEKDHLDIVTFLIEKAKVKFDAEDYYKRTPLLYAAFAGHEAIVKYLVAKGAKITKEIIELSGEHEEISSFLAAQYQKSKKKKNKETEKFLKKYLKDE